MTNQERAEKIYQYLLKPDSSLSFADPTDFIVSQLDEAQRETVERASILKSSAYLLGFAAAKEKAALVAENANEPFVNWNAFTASIASKIRAMTMEDK